MQGKSTSLPKYSLPSITTLAVRLSSSVGSNKRSKQEATEYRFLFPSKVCDSSSEISQTDISLQMISLLTQEHDWQTLIQRPFFQHFFQPCSHRLWCSHHKICLGVNSSRLDAWWGHALLQMRLKKERRLKKRKVKMKNKTHIAKEQMAQIGHLSFRIYDTILKYIYQLRRILKSIMLFLNHSENI